MTAHLTIGLVDDNDDDAANFTRAFASIATVQRWRSSEALIGELASNPQLLQSLDLLLLDLNLPGADGVNLIHELRADRGGKDLKIVMLTGSSAEHDILRALEASVDEYEVKPNDLAGLRDLVARCAALARPDTASSPSPAAKTSP